MKKILFTSLASLALLATACDDNNENNWENNTYNLQTTSALVVIPNNPSDVPYFEPEYSLRYSQSLGTGQMKVTSINTLMLPDGTNFAFTTPEFKPSGTSQTIIADPMPFDVNGKSVRVNLRCTNQYYSYSSTNTGILSVGPNVISVGTIKIDNDYSLKLLQEICAYSGKTTTLINGDNPYSNSEILYQVNLDLVKRTATVIMYNAKFAEAAPSIRVLRLRNLTLTADRSTGYKIEGTNVVPEVLEGDNWIANERYTFNSFTLAPTNDNLTTVSINYRVAESFTGTFNGSYIVQ